MLLVSVLRDPEVLSAVDEALFGGVEARCGFTSGASQERSFQTLVRPLDTEEDQLRRALLLAIISLRLGLGPGLPSASFGLGPGLRGASLGLPGLDPGRSGSFLELICDEGCRIDNLILDRT
jgi:hypothetical protein